MKKKYYLLALASVLVLGACSAQKSEKKLTTPSSSIAKIENKLFSSSQTEQSSSTTASSSEANGETTKKYQYQLQANGVTQTQVYEVTYNGAQFQRLLLTLIQPLPAEQAAALNDSNREEYLRILREAPGIKEAEGVQGMTATVNLNEQNQPVIAFDMDMQQLDIDAASKITSFGPMFSGLKNMSPTDFIKGLEFLGATEIK
ncbi:SP0191 family lipoprotein [Streptococcus gallinaceus]|uniref:SP-0191-like C-terminal domain-containing protein n=1 Tax=Streptococcus gallinaceus TaxID=165758 RepID=A0ABV2JK31_9STRE